jgi:hypothetical protein
LHFTRLGTRVIQLAFSFFLGANVDILLFYHSDSSLLGDRIKLRATRPWLGRWDHLIINLYRSRHSLVLGFIYEVSRILGYATMSEAACSLEETSFLSSSSRDTSRMMIRSWSCPVSRRGEGSRCAKSFLDAVITFLELSGSIIQIFNRVAS